MDKNKEIILTGIVVDNSYFFTIEEVKNKLNIADEILDEMLAYGLFEPAQDAATTNLVVDLKGLNRIEKAWHLYQDLEVNMSGAAVILELLDELNELRSQMAIMEKHFK